MYSSAYVKSRARKLEEQFKLNSDNCSFRETLGAAQNGWSN